MTDLDELERLARRTNAESDRLHSWTKEEAKALGIATWLPWIRSEYREDIADFVLAASPDVILDLIARVRAAEGTVTLLSDEMRRKGLTSGSAMAAHLDVELGQMKPKP